MIKAIVGSGGKTTLVKRYAREYCAQGLKVFVTTSTHMFIEEDTLLTDDPARIIRELEEKHYAMAGVREGQKLCALSRETYEAVCPHADVVLIEADGSKRLPVKFPASHEPVIYDNVDEIEVVCGLFAIGKPAKEVCHRLELVKQCLSIGDDTPITAAHIQSLVTKGYVEPLRAKYPDKKITVHPSHDSSLYQRAVAALMAAEMDVSLIREEWFRPQPKLVICGGGHVALELAKMASLLDLPVKVLDDRQEFANRERFDTAEDVICDSFLNLERYLEKDAYYVVLTRGHQDDYTCVRTIVDHSYHYLGMIGSRRKVGQTFDRLRADGVSEERIASIHAPIGLAIGAVTPAEIAVSILAQIIQEKSKTHVASAERELLDIQEHGVLCIILEKHGSSPRGEGSMMFVEGSRTVGSIGGGAVELAAIREARACRQPMIREYRLNSEDVANLGMICGGSNKVLFLPL